MRQFWLPFVLASLTSASPILQERQTSDSSPLVQLDYATYRGTRNSSTGYDSFLGIRYAAAPVDDLRFRAPIKPEQNLTVQDATYQPPTCVQAAPEPFGQGNSNATAVLASLSAEVQGQEDCLFLNVVTPSNATSDSKLPVLFWIYGGGYSAGSIAQYDFGYLASTSAQDLVFVAVQYRLGLFGFLAGSEYGQDADYNLGILDQQAGLQWVQENIHKFGGDKDHVTIWGESAGAGSVLQHIIANNGSTQPSLFEAAITHSPFEPPQYNYDDEFPEMVYQGTLAAAGVDSLSALRNLSTEELFRAQAVLIASLPYGVWGYTPVMDGTFLTGRPLALLEAGRFNGKKLYTTHNINEGAIFTQMPGNGVSLLDAASYAQSLAPQLNAAAAQEIAQVYTQTYGAAANEYIYGEGTFVCQAIFLAQAYGDDSYFGVFAPPPSLHGYDIAAYFPAGRSNPGTPLSDEFILQFSSAITSFARTYNPNTLQAVESTPLFPTYNQSPPMQMVFNQTVTGANNQTTLTSEVTQVDPGLLNRCELWRRVAPEIPLR